MAEPNCWERPYFQPGGNDALVLFHVFGEFSEPFCFSPKRHRTNGLPRGVVATRYSRSSEATIFEHASTNEIEKLLGESRGLSSKVHDSSHCVEIKGLVNDPISLLYLRDVIGVLKSLLDSGGVAILDWQMLKWWDAKSYNEKIFGEDRPTPQRHVNILVTPEEGDDQQVWFHTRGMRKFGRPDLSIHKVNPAYQEPVIELCNRFIEVQALGQIIPDRMRIRMQSLPEGMICHHAGNLEDVDFNNTHIEVCWPQM